MNTNTGKTILAGLLPFMSNPAILIAVGFGAAGWVIYNKLTETGEDELSDVETVSNGSEPFDEPYETVYETVAETGPERLEAVASAAPATVHTTVEEPLWDNLGFKEQQEPVPDDINEERVKKEVIRQAMSELGKRSAAARAKKKDNGR